MKLEECCIVKDKSEFRIQKWNVMELKIIENKYNVEKKKKKEKWMHYSRDLLLFHFNKYVSRANHKSHFGSRFKYFMMPSGALKKHSSS